jgi:hypothetical protein
MIRISAVQDLIDYISDKLESGRRAQLIAEIIQESFEDHVDSWFKTNYSIEHIDNDLGSLCNKHKMGQINEFGVYEATPEIKDEFIVFATDYIMDLLSFDPRAMGNLFDQVKDEPEYPKVIENTKKFLKPYLNDIRLGNIWEDQKNRILDEFAESPNALALRISSIASRVANSQFPSKSRVIAELRSIIRSLSSH